ncbi:hypothetical protein CO683_00770 [Bradyrhizobium ottawaense]|uniref:hypothetical protein n=1 Tax=Bradyrhizobium ottawaense TaxID=931866 RepID=UPI000BE9D4F9|nr:hypothetical protein [Bradyrhizobium ottawaense]PDT71724.1 hypothetical protein CO683_00770 [Bradyrhizobium ottawaense]
MKIGDLAEYAIWVDGTETETMLRQWRADCSYMMARAHDPFLNLGPLSFEIKRPGEDRVPPVPDHIKGPDVRLLVATAEVLGFETVKAESFVSGLDKHDLSRLRKATREAQGRHLPDAICDQIIERMGPVAAGALAERALH